MDRAHLKIGPEVQLEVLLDGATYHWTEKVENEAAKCKLKLISGYPATSPDLNPIENLFGLSKKPMDAEQFKKPAEDEKETLKRFLSFAAREKTVKEVGNSIKSMPKRCKDVIEAEGGPTKW